MPSLATVKVTLAPSDAVPVYVAPPMASAEARAGAEAPTVTDLVGTQEDDPQEATQAEDFTAELAEDEEGAESLGEGAARGAP